MVFSSFSRNSLRGLTSFIFCYIFRSFLEHSNTFFLLVLSAFFPHLSPKGSQTGEEKKSMPEQLLHSEVVNNDLTCGFTCGFTVVRPTVKLQVKTFASPSCEQLLLVWLSPTT